MNPPGARSPLCRAAAQRGALALPPGERYAHFGLQEPALAGIWEFNDLGYGFMESIAQCTQQRPTLVAGVIRQCQVVVDPPRRRGWLLPIRQALARVTG